MTRPLSSVGWPKRTQDQIDKQLRKTIGATEPSARGGSPAIPAGPAGGRPSPDYQEAPGNTAPRRASKYRNKPTAYRSTRFGHERVYASKKEMRYAMALDLDPTVEWWLPQQPRFPLPGDVTYVADFLVIYRDGRLRIVDTKGYDKQEAKNKRKQVAAIYGITVELA